MLEQLETFTRKNYRFGLTQILLAQYSNVTFPQFRDVTF